MNTDELELTDLLEKLAAAGLCLNDVLFPGQTFRLRVAGWSMSPALRSGDLIKVEPADPPNLQVGDILLFHDNGRLICHRLVAIEVTPEGLRFVTKGDTATGCDVPLQPQQILGRVVQVRLNWPARLKDMVAQGALTLQRLASSRRLTRGLLQAIKSLAVTFRSAEVLVLCYHRVRSRERFAEQMAALAEHGYSILSLQQFKEWLDGSPLPSRPAVLLTFDGCYADQIENAVPVLESLNVPAVFFPASEGLTHTVPAVVAHWRETLLALTKARHAIGCHTHTHPDLTELSTAEIPREVIGSKQILEETLGQPVTAFCYPYGACNSHVVSMVRQARFDVAFTVDLGDVRSSDDCHRLNRVPILGEPRAAEFMRYLTGGIGVAGTILLYWKVRERILDLGWWDSSKARTV